MKKRFSLLIAVLAVFVMTSVSFAANTANLNITSEPIRQFAPCDKAGGIVGSFDESTTFRGGDQITFDLDFGVTLCKSIDFEAGQPSSLAHVLPIGWGQASYALPLIGIPGAGVLAEYALAPFHATQGGVLENPDPSAGVFFHVHGNAGSARVTIDVMTYDGTDFGADSSIVATFTSTGNQETARMTFAFLDQAIYDATASGHTGLFIPSDDFGIGWYTEAITLATVVENTMCIDVSQMPASITTFDGNFDSKFDKYTWLPSDPQIAHVAEANTFVFEECKGRNIGRTLCPGVATQGVDASCTPIENEMESPVNDGFCNNIVADIHRNNKVIIRTQNNTPFDSTQYSIELELLVDGVAGNNGAYWSNAEVLTAGYNDEASACAATNGSGTSVGISTYLDADGDEISAAASDTDCDIADANKAVKLVTPIGTLSLTASNDYLYVNLPAILRDSTLDSGRLSVKVTLIKAPCGIIFQDDWDIGDICCEATQSSGNLLYPYFAKSTGAFVNVIIIDNLDTVAGDAQITFFEDDGDQWQATVPVAGLDMYVSALVDVPVMQINGSGGTWGDAKCFAKVEAAFSADGSSWIVEPTSGQSFGYLPRVLY